MNPLYQTDLPTLGRNTDIDHHADLQVLQRIKRFLLPRDFEVSKDLLQQMQQGYGIADQPVDTLLSSGIKFAKPLQQLILHEQGIVQTSNVSAAKALLQQPAFETLYQQFCQYPSWYDAKLAEIGAIAYRRYPLMLIWLLRNVALMAGYSIPALSLPLIKTGALVHDALPRLMRTYAYILAVSEYPAISRNQQPPLAIGTEGWRQSLQVRQIHGLVRQQLCRHDWDSDYWGVPINQTDMVATHLQFSLLIMRGLKLLGGKSPVVVTPSADVAKTVNRVWTGKTMNAGQTCIAPDYVLIQADKKHAFIEQSTAWLDAHYPNLADNPDYSFIINPKQASRVQGYLDEAKQRGATLIPLTDYEVNIETGFFPPMIVTDLPSDAKLLTEEIFAPVLPLVSYQDLTQAVAYVNERDRPLALYVFGEDKAGTDYVLAHTVSGGACINETIFHIAQQNLPFGGVGASGMGRYHGKYSFDTFSHPKAVFKQSHLNFAHLLQPPYGKTFWNMMKVILKA